MEVENTADFLLNTFGISATEPPAADTPPAGDAPPANETPAEGTPSADEPPAGGEPSASEKAIDVSKAESAFAAMRVENKTYKQTLDGMARLLGLDEKDPAKLFEAVQSKVLEAQAKKDNVPVEILARLDASDADRAAREAEVRRAATNEGFAEVARQFQLDEAGIQEYALSLRALGIDPYTMDIDLPSMYKLQHFEAIVEQARKDGEAREAARLEKVNNHSTTPNNSTGKPPTAGSPVTTVKGLDDFFKSL